MPGDKDLEPCPMCGAALSWPDSPRRETRNGRGLLVDVACPDCPCRTTFFEDSGRISSCKPGRPIKVRVKRT